MTEPPPRSIAAPAGPAAPRDPGRVRARLLAVVAAVLVLAFLKWAAAALLPLAFGIFLVVLLWPLQLRLERRLPRRLAYLVAVLVLFAVFAGFFAALGWSGQRVLERAPEYSQRLSELADSARRWAAARGVSLGAGGGVSPEAVQRIARTAVVTLSASLTSILLILAFAVLALLEVHTFRAKAESAFRSRVHGDRLIASVHRIVGRYQQYLWARTVVAVLQGVTVWLLSLVLGLDFALVWGLIAALLNFVPTVGSVLAVIPPSLFALIQFDGWTRPLLVLIANSILQLVMGNFVDPKIEGRFLSLSPVVVLFAIVFWGWLWGVGGALLGVPIMVALVIVADDFPESRWLAAMMIQHPPPPRSHAEDHRVSD
ncbi:MAG TPA: AI-2E family transporter [Thermoanaerobaculia bacterium]|nr:AI-2E family transporter [Thermoanaerobaculia bacterium]